MRKEIKRISIYVLVIFALAIVFFNISNYIISSKLNNYLKTKLPESINLEYSQLIVNSWQGKLTLLNPKIINTEKTTHKKYIEASVDTIVIDGISYWDYFIHDKISIKDIVLSSPKVTFNQNQVKDTVQKKSSGKPVFKQLEVGRFVITHGTIAIRNAQTDSLTLSAKNLSLNIQNITLSGKTLSKKIPFTAKAYTLDFETLFYQLNAFDNLTIKTSKINEARMVFKHVEMQTKYSKQALSNVLATERDHFDVSIDSISMKSHDFGFKHDSLFYFHVPKTIFYQTNATIYRDKLVEDDPTIKPMYGTMLKALNIDLGLDDVEIKNANINYFERTKADNWGGEISFSKFNATLKNIGNTYKTPEKTTIAIQTNFMKTTPLKVDWSFDVNDVSDSFLFSGELGAFQTHAINKFSEPNLNMRFSGDILKTYFTISGNSNTSKVDLKTKYQEFDIVALQKDGNKKNKFLSNVLNILVFKDSKHASDNFREASKEDIQRDKTKSVFNFIWLNVKAGLLGAMTSKSKKD